MASSADFSAFPRRILLTGCAGTLGSVLRPYLRTHCSLLRLSDLEPPADPPQTGEEFVQCDLADREGMLKLLQGVDAVVHMGGTANELNADWTLSANILGVFNLYHAALEAGVRRMVLASSNHVTGYYPVGEHVTPQMPARPDSLYAVSKLFGENLSSYFFERHAIETLVIRIGSARISPDTRRSLDTWFGQEDFFELVRCGLSSDKLGHLVVYGVSNNPGRWWSDDAARIGFQPRQSAEDYRAAVEASKPPYAADDPLRIWQGGVMVTYDYRQPRKPKPLRKNPGD